MITVMLKWHFFSYKNLFNPLTIFINQQNCTLQQPVKKFSQYFSKQFIINSIFI